MWNKKLAQLRGGIKKKKRVGISCPEKPVRQALLFTHSRKLCYYKRFHRESLQPGNPVVCSPLKCISCANFQQHSQGTS